MSYKPFTFRLTYRFGAIHIGTAKFRAIEPEEHPFELPPHPDFDQYPLEAFEKGVEAVILSSHPIQKPLERLSMQRGVLCYVPVTYNRHYIDLSGSFQEYLDKSSHKKRYNLRREVRKLTEEGAEFQVFRSAEELSRFYPLAREVSRKTWHESLLRRGLPDTPEFKALMRAHGERDTARGYLLVKGGIPIAYQYAMMEKGVLMLMNLGYDPEFRNASPGTVLQYLALESLFAEKKFTIFDFEEGDSQYKQTFATESLECADVFLFAPTLRARTLIRAHLVLNALVRAVLAGTERAGLKVRLKRLLKARAVK